jgi:two-component system CheB/CheR fusion protein
MPLPTPCRILVVDDHPDSAESLARVIQSLGYEAEFLTDPLLVEAVLERFKPHVLLLDIAMPAIDGWTLARTLRQRFTSDALKMVAVSAFGTAKDHITSRKAGFDAHIAKPIDPDLVEVMLNQCFTDTTRQPPPR